MSDRERIIKNHIEIEDRIDEQCRGIYVATQPEELSEKWYMVGDENDENYHREAVHEVIPLSLWDQRYPEMNMQYVATNIIVKGFTYMTEPHYLGMKKRGSDDKKAAAIYTENFFVKENYCIYLMNRSQVPGQEDLADLAVMVEKLSDEKFALAVKPHRKKMELDAAYEVSEEEARELELQFYTNTAKVTQTIRENHIRQYNNAHQFNDGMLFT